MRCWRAMGLAALPLLASCAVQSQYAGTQATRDNLARFARAVDEAADCRARAARHPAYGVLRRHMPLINIGTATLPQAADADLATENEVRALDAWTRDLNTCRERLLQEIDTTVPTLGPVIEQARNDDAAVFVRLARRELTWGDAVLHLMRNRTALRAGLVSGANQLIRDLAEVQQAQLGRRTAVLSSIIRILP